MVYANTDGDRGSFKLTTGDDENVFVRDGKLVIKPSAQNENYIDNTDVTNLTADGTCTSNTVTDCVLAANRTAGQIVQPAKSARITTKDFAVIRYGRVDIVAKVAARDWLLSQMVMYPAEDYYGPWPASGEVDIVMVRSNNYSYNDGQGNQLMQSSLHWGPDSTTDRWQLTTGTRDALHSTFHEKFHTFGLSGLRNTYSHGWTLGWLRSATPISSRTSSILVVTALHYKMGPKSKTLGKDLERAMSPHSTVCSFCS